MPSNHKEQTSPIDVGNSTTNTGQTNKITLLSLPDDALDIIFRHLDAFDKSLACQKRDAFSFALANKRLFGLFPYHLSSITPRISNESLPTIALPHMLSVVRLAGNWLRELHVSKPSYDILPLLPDLCPNLRKLVLDTGFSSEHAAAIKPIFSNLRSLSIIRPCSETLKYLTPPPEELRLTELEEELTDELVEILRHPLKKFHLHIRECPGPPRLSHRLLSVLHERCPKMEEVSIELTRLNYYTPFRMEQLLRDVKSVKRNASSKCQKMVLHGHLRELVTHAHPGAFVEISVREQTVVDDAGNCFAKGIVSIPGYLREPFLSMIDQSTEILITSNANPRWKDVLKGRRFKRVMVRSPERCNGFELSADVVEVQAQILLHPEVDWKWLQDVNEVKFVGICFWVYGDDMSLRDNLRSFAKLLKTFRGTRVWLKFPYRFCDLRVSQQLRYEAAKTLEALNKFERRGGDATTLRKMLDTILE